MHRSIWIWMQHNNALQHMDLDAAYGCIAAYAGRLADLQSLSSLSMWMQHMEASQHMLRGLRTYRGYV